MARSAEAFLWIAGGALGTVALVWIGLLIRESVREWRRSRSPLRIRDDQVFPPIISQSHEIPRGPERLSELTEQAVKYALQGVADASRGWL